MSLFFQYPAAWGLLALAGVPLLVHLIARTRPPHYRFSNLDFLQRVVRRTARLRQPKDWLLLVLRTLALAALAAAFLGPLLLSQHAALPGETRTVVLLIDRSGSMSAREGAGSRFAAATSAAVRTLDDLQPQLANLVWIDAEPAAAFPEPSPNRAFLADTIKRASAKPEPGAIERALELALRQCAAGQGRRELIIISDFQASAWKNIVSAVPAGVQLRTIPIAKETLANLAITSLVCSPAEPIIGQTASVLCRVKNLSPEPRRTRITLDTGGTHPSESIEIPAWGEAEAAFNVRCDAAGLMPLLAEIDADGFPADDRRFLVMRVRESLQLAIPENDPTSAVLHQLANALPWLDVLPVADPLQPATSCDAVWIPAWNDHDPASLRALAERGITVLARPAPGSLVSGVGALAGIPPEADTATIAPQARSEGWKATPESGPRVFDLFASGEFGNPLAGTFRQRLRLPDNLPGKPRLLARYDDGVPALASYETTGAPIVLFNLALDPAVTDWPVQSVFLPAFAELLLHHRPARTAAIYELPPGAFAAWTPEDPSQASTLTLQAPNGETLELRQALATAGAVSRAATPAVPGIYRWLVSGQAVHMQAVNFPDSESDLRPLAEPPALAANAPHATRNVQRGAFERGMVLWPWLLAAVLLTLAIEAVIARNKPVAP